MSDTVSVTDADFEAVVLRSALPVLVDFWAPWCGPCRMMAPVIETIEKKYSGKIKVVKLNTDENQETAAAYGIMSIPTLIVFKGGQEVARNIGYQPAEVLARSLDKVLG